MTNIAESLYYLGIVIVIINWKGSKNVKCLERLIFLIVQFLVCNYYTPDPLSKFKQKQYRLQEISKKKIKKRP